MDVRRRAGWMPEQADLEEWLVAHRERVSAKGERTPLHPVVMELQQLLDNDPMVRMYAERMIAEVPPGKSYSQRHVEDVPQLLRLIDEVLTLAPEFSEDAMVITPLNAVLDWAMGTTAGFAAFRDPRVNAALKKILDAWCAFLSSADSRYVLNDSPSGWKSEEARRAVGMDQYEHDPDDEYWGFASWNDFFTRRFKDGERPVASPEDDKVVVSACESTPYGISRDVRRSDQFWVKAQSYSLQDMLAGDESVEEFVGGTVYQAYLSATNYHRWHSPVAGTVVRAFNIDGTYYSEADTEGADAVEPQNSQGYMAHVATRAVILIQADNPATGLVAFVPVGMSDVSSCKIGPDVVPGHHLAKGEELGYFQFGGSTYCLVFRPGVIADFAFTAVPAAARPDRTPGPCLLPAGHRDVSSHPEPPTRKPASRARRDPTRSAGPRAVDSSRRGRVWPSRLSWSGRRSPGRCRAASGLRPWDMVKMIVKASSALHRVAAHDDALGLLDGAAGLHRELHLRDQVGGAVVQLRVRDRHRGMAGERLGQQHRLLVEGHLPSPVHVERADDPLRYRQTDRQGVAHP